MNPSPADPLSVLLFAAGFPALVALTLFAMSLVRRADEDDEDAGGTPRATPPPPRRSAPQRARSWPSLDDHRWLLEHGFLPRQPQKQD